MKRQDLISKGDEKAMASTPFFSIVIPTYNRAKLLKRALESLISQTETDWEAIIVDDGSTDDTYTDILPYLKVHPEINYIKKKHSGSASSKNEGIFNAKGKYISFLDSDDEYATHHLNHRKDILTKNPSVQFLYGGVQILGSKYVPDRFDTSKLIHLKDCVIGGSFFVKRTVLIALNGLKDMPLGADADLFDRAEEAQLNMMEVYKDSYIYHHENIDSITNRISSNQESYKIIEV